MFRLLVYVIGAVVGASGVAMLPAAIVSLLYREWDTAAAIAISAVITLICGESAGGYWAGPASSRPARVSPRWDWRGSSWRFLALSPTC